VAPIWADFGTEEETMDDAKGTREMASIKKNIGLQTVYQVLETCLPLITSPYLSRVLGASQLGVFSYTQSIANYFTLFAMLGFINYGTRSIAAVSENVQERSKTFWSIYALQFLASFIAMTGYASYLLFFCKENFAIGVIQTLAIAACFLNISWLFFGLEKFSISVTRNAVIRVCTVILILTLVKKQEDLWIYALLMVSSTLLSQAVLWFYVPKLVQGERLTLAEVTSHIKPVVAMFVPMAAMSIYHIMDKTMLGIMSSFEQTGYYYNADKIINIPAGVLSGIGTVMMPRVSAMIAQNKEGDANELFRRSMEGTVWIASALAFGIAAIARDFIPFFFGAGYDPCVRLTIVLSSVLMIKGYSFSARYQYLIPRRMDKIFICSTLIGAIISVFVNLVTIPRLGAMGAVIGTLAAELAACVFQFSFIRKYVNYRKTLEHTLMFLLFGASMFLIVRFIGNFWRGSPGVLVLEISVGAITYIALTASFLVVSGKRGIICGLFHKGCLDKKGTR